MLSAATIFEVIVTTEEKLKVLETVLLEAAGIIAPASSKSLVALELLKQYNERTDQNIGDLSYGMYL